MAFFETLKFKNSGATIAASKARAAIGTHLIGLPVRNHDNPALSSKRVSSMKVGQNENAIANNATEVRRDDAEVKAGWSMTVFIFAERFRSALAQQGPLALAPG